MKKKKNKMRRKQIIIKHNQLNREKSINDQVLKVFIEK